MADLAKWGMILATLVAVIAIIIQLPATGALDDIFTDGGAGETIANAFSILGTYLLMARRIINNFVYPPALTAIIVFSLTMWFVFWIIRLSTFVTRMIYK